MKKVSRICFLQCYAIMTLFQLYHCGISCMSKRENKRGQERARESKRERAREGKRARESKTAQERAREGKIAQ